LKEQHRQLSLPAAPSLSIILHQEQFARGKLSSALPGGAADSFGFSPSSLSLSAVFLLLILPTDLQNLSGFKLAEPARLYIGAPASIWTS